MYLEVEEVPGIQRDGIDLNSTVSISYLDAILGTVVKVTFYCTYEISILHLIFRWIFYWAVLALFTQLGHGRFFIDIKVAIVFKLPQKHSMGYKT